MDDKVIIALVGFGGAIVGSIATVLNQVIKHLLDERSKALADQPRKALLKQMLADQGYDWRNLATLAHVIGTDDEHTKRLLLEIGARASENGDPKWALIKNKPLPKVQ